MFDFSDLYRGLRIFAWLFFSIIPSANANNILGFVHYNVDDKPLKEAVIYPFIDANKTPVGDDIISITQTKLPDYIPKHWHVITVNRETLMNECTDQGRLRVIDWNAISHRDLMIPGARETCGIGYNIAATVLAYSITHKYGTPPYNWNGLFDLNRYPGKRALPKQGRGNLEIALLADGVPITDIYTELSTPAGIARAFEKLDSIRSEILWWDHQDQAKNWLLSGNIVMAVGDDGAFLSDDGFDNIGIVRDNVIYRIRYLAILKDIPNPDLAYSFINFATLPQQQLNMAKTAPYGMILKNSERLIGEVIRNKLTNFPINLKNGLLEDYIFYSKHGEMIEEKFNEWLNRHDVTSTRLQSDEPASELPRVITLRPEKASNDSETDPNIITNQTLEKNIENANNDINDTESDNHQSNDSAEITPQKTQENTPSDDKQKQMKRILLTPKLPNS